MSCAAPNLQQVPTDPQYRACFRAGARRVLVAGDYSTIELRLAAEIASDERMIEAFAQKEDLHVITAAAVLDKSTTEVTKSERDFGKTLNLAMLYGQGARGLRDTIARETGQIVSEGEADWLRSKVFSTYQGLSAWQRSYHEPSRRETPIATRTVLGRRRLRVQRLTEKLNSGVQGSGADGLKAALALLWQSREEAPGACPVLVVHDEVVIEADDDRAEQAAQWLKDCLKRGVETVLRRVPVEVDVKIGRAWSIGKA